MGRKIYTRLFLNLQIIYARAPMCAGACIYKCEREGEAEGDGEGEGEREREIGR